MFKSVDLEFDSLCTFGQYATQVIKLVIIPKIIDLYRRHNIEHLPKNIKNVERKVNVSNLNKVWFKQLFEGACDCYANCEEVAYLKIINDVFCDICFTYNDSNNDEINHEAHIQITADGEINIDFSGYLSQNIVLISVLKNKIQDLIIYGLNH